MKVFGFAGFSGSGKTTLIEKLIPRFTQKGLRVSLIKHAHHGFSVDIPGKDSWRHREAGSSEVLVVSPQRWALMHELRAEPEPTLEQCIARLSPCDLVLIEGYKRHPVPQLETWREANGKPMLNPEDPGIVAIASDVPVQTRVRRLALDDVDGIADFILNHLNMT